MRTTAFLLIALYFVLSGCKNSDSEKPIDRTETPADTSKFLTNAPVADGIVTFSNKRCPLELRGNGLEISIDSFYYCEYQEPDYDYSNDTITIPPDLEYSIYGKRIRIASSGSQKLIIEQSYETSKAVGDEGPHIDFVEWKHYNSPWLPLMELGESAYMAMYYDTTSESKFPKVTEDEKRKAILTYAGDEWLSLYDSILKKGVDISYSGITRVYIRIKNESGQNLLVLVFEDSLGC